MPDHLLGEMDRRFQIFLDLIEAATVHFPSGAAFTNGYFWNCFQRSVKMHEIER
ncbi:Uncharacterised protein [Mycobacterium tuberculosis]|nr:Uncharacterised protein [Mycobacterium tuberculosis]